MALGASSRDIVRLILREARVYGAVGMMAGFAAAFGLGRVLSSLLAGVSPADPLSYAGAGLLLLMVVGGAALVPALRAARVEPSVALRHE